MLINQNSITWKNRVKTLAALAVISIITGCAHQTVKKTPHGHERARFDIPENRPSASDVPYGKTDWNAVIASLGGAGKKASAITKQAGGYGRSMWQNTGGKIVDVAAGRIVGDAPGSISNCGFAWPANGKISRGFRPSDNHKGLDITGPVGVPVYAARAGKVIYASNELSGFGNCIIIQHDPVWTTFYAHNDRNLVRPGDVVQCGQQIAEMGKTGRASGPHLHFEIRENGTPLDPHPMLP